MHPNHAHKDPRSLYPGCFNGRFMIIKLGLDAAAEEVRKPTGGAEKFSAKHISFASRCEGGSGKLGG